MHITFFVLPHNLQYNIINIYKIYKNFAYTVSLYVLNKTASRCVEYSV